MRTVHLLRKLDPSEWGGTETAIQRLVAGLNEQGVDSTVYCPRLDRPSAAESLLPGCSVRRFWAFLPIVGISRKRRRQMVAGGGNLMSFDLVTSLWREREAAIIHTHALGRIGGIARTVAKRRGVPFVVSIHGGVMDLPDSLRQSFNAPVSGGWEWGKPFGWVFESRHLFRDADAIVTCNEKEAALLRQSLGDKRIVVQPHGVPVSLYRQNHRETALAAFPQIRGRPVLLCVGRIDPVKNQHWLIDQAPAIFQRHPETLLVLAGACTDEPYGERIQRRIDELGLRDRVLLTGGLPPNDPRLIGLLQESKVVLVPSVSETFGLVILEAWAAGAMVVSSRASGPAALVRHGSNGWLFDLDRPGDFHEAVDRTLTDPQGSREMAAEGAKVTADYSIGALAGRVKTLYEQLIEGKRCVT
jgi:alpha-maltose-1-phosphate synthase